jgi:hypothetical protein
MTEPRLPVHLRPQEHLPPERPLPDWAPFAVPSDEVWRELQRRRNLISTVRALATAARDEGYTICAVLLARLSAFFGDESIVPDKKEVTP